MKLLDTSVLVDDLRRGFELGAISVITLVEILMGVRHEKRKEVKKYLEESFEVLSLGNEVILKYCEVYNYLKQRGMMHPNADLLIATTAPVHNTSLVTKDTNFKRIERIRLKLKLGEGQIYI